MRKRRIAVELFAMMIAVTGVFHGSMNVNAATKKITVDQTYENATKIKGKTKKGCVVKVKIGKKTYRSFFQHSNPGSAASWPAQTACILKRPTSCHEESAGRECPGAGPS